MELGKFGPESSPLPSDNDSEKSAPRKKKSKHATDAPQGEPHKDNAREERKRPAADSFAPLLERITANLKPEEQKVAETDKKPEERKKSVEEPEKKDTGDDNPEKLSTEERREAAEVYLDERERRLASDRENAAPETADANIAEAVDTFLARTREKLAAVPEADADEAADESFDEVAREYAPDVPYESEAAREQTSVLEPAIEPKVLPLPEASLETATPAYDDVEQRQAPSPDDSDVARAMAYEDMAPRVPEVNLLPGHGELATIMPYELPPTEGLEGHEQPAEPLTYAYAFQPPQAEPLHNQQPFSVAAATGAEALPRKERAMVPVAVPLIVGFAAYLVGKRRGRIHAEERLLPVQKKLEREVRAIHEKLAAKETELRTRVRRQMEINVAAGRPTLRYGRELAVAAAGAAVSAGVALEHTPAVPVQARHRAAQEARSLTVEVATPRRDVPAVRTPEQLAAMPVAEAPEPESMNTQNQAEVPKRMASPAEVPHVFAHPRPNVYESAALAVSPEALLPTREVLSAVSLTREEVTKAADEIIVGAATVRQVFETGLISERGMRRVVAEAKRGGDVRRVLAEEMMIKETGYERDPRLRDQPMQRGRASVASVQPPVIPTPVAPQLTPQPAALAPMHTPPHASANPLPQSALVAANVVALVILGILLLILFVIHL